MTGRLDTSTRLLIAGLILIGLGMLFMIIGHQEKLQAAKDQCNGVLVKSYEEGWVCLKHIGTNAWFDERNVSHSVDLYSCGLAYPK